MSSDRKLLVKSAGLLSFMTLTSRILGLARDVLSAKSFGTSWQWDGFVYAFMLPNFFRRVVGEGALSNAFIPVYNETLAKDGLIQARQFANVMLSFFATALAGALIVIQVILNLMILWAPMSPILHLTVDLLRILFPYLWFISMYAMVMGVLNSHQHFFAPSLASIILDLMWIGGVVWICPLAGPDLSEQLHALSWVILGSGLFQLAAELPPLYKMGFRFKYIFTTAHAGLRKTLRLLIPAVINFAVVQINILVDMTLGLLIGAGANSSLWYGSRLMQFPLGIFSTAIGTALLPMISRLSAVGDWEAAKKTLSFALRAVFLIVLPSSVGLIVLREPIVRLLFERGEFDALSTARTASVLLFYSLGLFAHAGQTIIASAFYAVQDPKTPMKMGIFALIVNIFFNLILMGPMKESGLALSTSIAGIAEFLILVWLYSNKVTDFPMKTVVQSFLKISAASSCMGILCMFLFPFIEKEAALFASGWPLLAVSVFGSIGVSAIGYVLFCFLFRVREMSEALQWVLKRKRTLPAA